MIYISLRQGIESVMGTTPRRDWQLAQIIAGVANLATVNDHKEWGGQSNLSHRVRSELAKLVKAGVVNRVRWATYRLN